MIRIASFLILSSLVLTCAASAQDEAKASAVIDSIRASVLAGDFETTSSLFGEQFTMVHVMGKRFTQEWTRAGWVEQVAKGAGGTRHRADQQDRGRTLRIRPLSDLRRRLQHHDDVHV